MKVTANPVTATIVVTMSVREARAMVEGYDFEPLCEKVGMKLRDPRMISISQDNDSKIENDNG